MKLTIQFPELEILNSSNYHVLNYIRFLEYDVIKFKKNLILSFHNTLDDHSKQISEQLIKYFHCYPDNKVILINDGTIDFQHKNLKTIDSKYHYASLIPLNLYNFKPPKKEKSKWFFSLNKRGTQFRQQLFSYILDKKIENFGYFSYLCNEKNVGPLEKIGVKDLYNSFNIGEKYVNLIPYSNFEQPEIYKKDFMYDYKLIKNFPKEISDECLFHIIIETHIQEKVYLTEKCLLPLASGAYPIIFGPKNIINYLQNIGFKFPENFFHNFSHESSKLPNNGWQLINWIVDNIENDIKNNNLQELSNQWYEYGTYNFEYFHGDFQKNWNTEKKEIINLVKNVLDRW